MFPNSTGITLNNETKSSSGTKSYLFDFDSADFVVRDGKLVECGGIDAIKVWTEKILRTEKGSRKTLIRKNTTASSADANGRKTLKKSNCRKRR